MSQNSRIGMLGRGINIVKTLLASKSEEKAYWSVLKKTLGRIRSPGAAQRVYSLIKHCADGIPNL